MEEKEEKGIKAISKGKKANSLTVSTHGTSGYSQNRATSQDPV